MVLALQGRPPGEVVEWLMAPVLKTGEVKASVGSNPTLSAFSTAPARQQPGRRPSESFKDLGGVRSA